MPKAAPVRNTSASKTAAGFLLSLSLWCALYRMKKQCCVFNYSTVRQWYRPGLGGRRRLPTLCKESVAGSSPSTGWAVHIFKRIFPHTFHTNVGTVPHEVGPGCILVPYLPLFPVILSCVPLIGVVASQCLTPNLKEKKHSTAQHTIQVILFSYSLDAERLR